MNFKTKLSIFATSLLMAACSSESVIDAPKGPDVTGQEDDGNRQEVELLLKNTLNLNAPQRAGRAAGDPIATEEENYIRSLDVYVFGSKEENGTYTFQELHYYRDDASEVNIPNVNAYSFNLNPSEKDNATTSGLLKVRKGLFVKFYCVANRTQLYQTKPDGTIEAYSSFMSLEQSAPGQADNSVVEGAPLEEVFTKFHTKLIDTETDSPGEEDVLNTPLPMTGAYTTPLDLTDFSTSARTQISFKLSRMVARFDVVNDSKTSKFTIEKISMGKGQKAARFFPIQSLYTGTENLITYPEREISAQTQKNPKSYPDDPDAALLTDVTKGAFYTWPSPKDDHGFLILKGKYAVNKTEQKEVTYQIPFEQVVDGVGTYIEVAYNHRYTIAITKADDYHLDFHLKVADWDEGEKVDDYEPENTLDSKTPIKLEADINLTNKAYVTDDGQVELLAKAGSKFGFKMESNTTLKRELIFKKGSEEWITDITPAKPGIRAASMIDTLSYQVNEAKLGDRSKILPVTLRLTNPASGERKNITIVPAPGPTVTKVQEMSYSTFDPKTLVATMYNVANQQLKLNVQTTRRSDGAEIPTYTMGSDAVSADTWLTLDQATSNLQEAVYTLTLGAVQDLSLSNSTTVDFTSKPTEESTKITVNLKSPDMEPIASKNFQLSDPKNAIDMTGNSQGGIKVTLVGYETNYFKLTVTSPEGVDATAESENNVTKDWLEVETAAGEGLLNGMKTTIITGKINKKIKDDKGIATEKNNGKITITNNIDPTKTVIIEVATSLPDGPTFTIDNTPDNLGLFDSKTNEATIYNALDQKITLIANESCQVVGTTPDWLNVNAGESTTHTITISKAQNDLSTKGTVQFLNTKGGITAITVVLEDPVITAPVAANFSSMGEGGGNDNTFAVASGPDNATITMADAKENNFVLLVIESPNGIEVADLEEEVQKWLNVRIVTTSGGGTRKVTDTVRIELKDEGGNQLDTDKNTTITLKNKIANGGDLEIDVKALAPVP